MTSDPLTPRAREIVQAARALLDEEGPEGVSMRRIADRVGIKAPSIYKHLPDKDSLEAALISTGFEEQAALAEAAVRRSKRPIPALARTYRVFALSHPHLYRLMTTRPLKRELLEPGVEERAARPVLDAAGGNVNRARALWAFAHGMTLLELDGRFPDDANVDAAWRAGVAAFDAG